MVNNKSQKEAHVLENMSKLPMQTMEIIHCDNAQPYSRQEQRANANHKKKSQILKSAYGVTLLCVSLIVLAIVVIQISSEENEASSTHEVLRRLGTVSRTISRKLYTARHAPLFPLQMSDNLGLFCAVLGLMVAAGGGIGGGGILVPIYILVMGFAPKHAIPLSNVTVFGGACANYLLNMPKRHPLADRPLTDWDLILVMEPLTIAGALIGAFLNKVLPESVLTFMLVLLLSFTAYNTLTKATKLYVKETKEIQDKQESKYDEEATLLKPKNIDITKDYKAIGEPPSKRLYNGLYKKEELNDGLVEILEEERVTPIKNVCTLVILFVVTLMLNLSKGGGAMKSPFGIECGSRDFWLVNILILVWISAVVAYARQGLVSRHEKKTSVGYKYIEGDIKWDARATIIYPMVCCLAGFFAGMFGVGGGIVKGPLMLAMGVHPQVSSATSACMILFTSFTATTSFYVFGLLITDYAIACLFIGFIATFVGQVIMGHFMKKYGRSSYIAFSIGIVVLLSAFLMSIQSLLAMADGEGGDSGGVCSVAA